MRTIQRTRSSRAAQVAVTDTGVCDCSGTAAFLLAVRRQAW
jgi:hypothetical protein